MGGEEARVRPLQGQRAAAEDGAGSVTAAAQAPQRHAALTSSAWSHWTTPDVVLHRVRCIEPIDLDPCGNAADQVGARESWFGPQHKGTNNVDGLHTPWVKPGRGLIYVNPPYGREIGDWIAKARGEYEALSAEVVMLVPARTDTVWWHDHVAGVARGRCFWKGRLRFGNPAPGKGSGESSTFPSALLYYGRRPYTFAAAFEDAGEIVI